MPVKFHGGRRDLDSGKGGRKGKRETLKKAEKFKNGKKVYSTNIHTCMKHKNTYKVIPTNC